MVKPSPLTFGIAMPHFLPYSSSMRCVSAQSTHFNLPLQSFLMTCLGKTGFRRVVPLMTYQVLSIVMPRGPRQNGNDDKGGPAGAQTRLPMTSAGGGSSVAPTLELNSDVIAEILSATHAMPSWKLEGLPSGRYKLGWDGGGEHTEICLLYWCGRPSTSLILPVGPRGSRKPAYVIQMRQFGQTSCQ